MWTGLPARRCHRWRPLRTPPQRSSSVFSSPSSLLLFVGLSVTPSSLAQGDAAQEVPDVVHEEAGDTPPGLPGELRLPRPVAAQSYLRVALRVYVPRLDEPAHYRAVREFDSEDLGAGIGVRVEVHQANGSIRGGAGAHVRLGDRVE